MKPTITLPRLILAALILAPFVGLRGQVLLTDDFSGGSLNGSNWTTILPTGGSTVVQSGGVVTTTNRGILATANQYSAPYVISGSFTMLDASEHFNVAFRTDLSSEGAAASYERAGLLVAFSNDGNQISIQRYTSSSDNAILASASYVLNPSQLYSFSITDSGNLITLAVNGVDQISANSTYSTGNYIGFYSREFGSGTAIDSITVSAIPEPSTYAVILGVVAMIGVVARNRRLPRIV